MPTDLVPRLKAALPQVRTWIDEYLAAHAAEVRPVRSCGWARLPACYPSELLERTKFAPMARIEFPPVANFGIPEFAAIQQRPLDGITFKDTFFIREDRQSELLFFHEMVHVVQWARLGVDNFLLAYGVGLQVGYERNPFELMVYGLQDHFGRGTLPAPLVPTIEQWTDNLWAKVMPHLQ